MESSLTFKDYPFLAELGLTESNLGCYRNGEWVGADGGQSVSINPHNQKQIASTTLASLSNYEECI
jgi:aldehyde dehydrogenase family 7 protein A1